MEIEKTIVIGRPVEEVWAFIADARNDPRWCKKVESVDQVSGDEPVAAGSLPRAPPPDPAEEAQGARRDRRRVQPAEPPAPARGGRRRRLQRHLRARAACRRNATHPAR